MQYVISQPSASKPATHKSPQGPLVNVLQVADTVKVYSPNPVLTSLTGYTALTAPTKSVRLVPATATDKAAAVAKVTDAFNAAVTKGVTLPFGKATITLPADRTSKHELTSLAAHLVNSKAAATSGVSIDDIDGNLIAMTAAQFQTLMAAYGQACLEAWTAFRQRVSQINAATDVATINLIAS
jgi:hypothetical protein